MTSRTKGLNLHIRIPFVIACLLLGLLLPLFFLLAAFTAWTIYADIKEAPEREAQRIEAEIRANAPLSVDDIRYACESPAEEAFLDAMVEAFDLKTGPGAIEGGGLRLRNQVGMGRLNIYRSGAFSQYRADFLIDDQLVVEVDGQTYHSSPEAIERDRIRDADLKRDGYSILRIPAQIVFQNPKEAVRRVQNARV